MNLRATAGVVLGLCLVLPSTARAQLGQQAGPENVAGKWLREQTTDPMSDRDSVTIRLRSEEPFELNSGSPAVFGGTQYATLIVSNVAGKDAAFLQIERGVFSCFGPVGMIEFRADKGRIIKVPCAITPTIGSRVKLDGVGALITSLRKAKTVVARFSVALEPEPVTVIFDVEGFDWPTRWRAY